MKALDYNYTDLLVRLFLNIANNGMVDLIWATNETKKLQDTEGSIDVLTYRLAKTRFWNYISNRTQWTQNNQDLKQLALETESFLSDVLHERLTNELKIRC